MKRKILLLASLCITGVASAQEQNGVGIGVPLPDASAILHVESSNKGLLIPNVVIEDLKSKAPITSDIKESLLVYNKQEKKEDVTGKILIAKGYYYWVATDATTGKWVRVITSEDAGEILNGQVQEYFVETKTERDMPKIGVDGKVVRDEKGKVITEKREVGGTYVYVADKTKVGDATFTDRMTIDIPSLVKEQETITSFGLDQYELFHYTDGKKFRKKLSKEEELEQGVSYLDKSTEIEIVYTDERGELNKFAVRDLLGADNEDVGAITKLEISPSLEGLTYTNDKGQKNDISLLEVVRKLETSTTLEIDSNDNLVYVNERQTQQQINIRSVVREPWHVAETGVEATANNQNIFNNGWVGIGLDSKTAAESIANLKEDEKLRVNGSIYARNSYYADYVFENYFTKEASALKYDYKFNDLATVESFIKAYRHLPGITPIGDLDKATNEGYLINVSELSVQLLEKVEELYLHTIDQNKLIQQQAEQLEKQENRLRQLEAFMNNNK
ncbi:hypothetical protein AV926_18170 [Myroides marinus]|uniref:Uncharacterized protein n=1 Tax=Myroides marinus TaxID=703342 RepID=A0A165Q6E8_9FLAO|nr:hypothetical protein [Myroides marinus]KZE73799.1 hypothetical protein AV926_18170 [Myroides marinus]